MRNYNDLLWVECFYELIKYENYNVLLWVECFYEHIKYEKL